uniref:RSE1/DDB1/CPSF1 second beta-propeller domain-containing protein n=1 Tax=Hyaloperonospora arabidopsidis (strain Emoy2) TaxID=559515 RepID=M4B6I3_HYAAE
MLAQAEGEGPGQQEVPIKEEALGNNVTLDGKHESAEEEEEDDDDLFLYGAAPSKEAQVAATDAAEIKNEAGGSHVTKGPNGTSTIEESGPYEYELRQVDVLPGIGQITSIELGVASKGDSNEKREELVISGGYERSGGISVLHNGLRPIVGTEAELSGCRAMWTVSSSLPSATTSVDGRSYSAYLILSVAHRTLVLRTGEGMEPLEDDSGFYTSGPTLAAANLFSKQRIVQIFKQGARVMMEVVEEKESSDQDQAASADEDDEDCPSVKLVCTQEITLEGDIECGGMNVDTSSVGIVSVDVVDPYILLLLTDGSVRLLVGDDEDMELTVIDPEIDYFDGIVDANGAADTSKHGSSSACLFYDWAGMFCDVVWDEDDVEEMNVSAANEVKKEKNDEEDDMDALYSTKLSPRATATDRSNKSDAVLGQEWQTNADGSVSIPLLKQKDAKMMCGMCFGDGSLRVFSLPHFEKRGVFPYLTFAPQSLVNTIGHHRGSKGKITAPALGLNASTSIANDGRIKKSHTIHSPVADISIHRVGPSEGQHNAQYLSQMVMLVFLANGDLLTYVAIPKDESIKRQADNEEVVPVYSFVRAETDIITRPLLPTRSRTNAHSEPSSNSEINVSSVLAKLRAGFRYPMLTNFANVNNMSGAFFRGAHPMWILGDRGQPTFVPMCVAESTPPIPRANDASNRNTAPRVSVPVLSITPFHHWNCPNGFIYFHSRGALRVCELPSSKTSTILPSSGGFVLQKAEFGATLHHMLYLGNRGPGGVAEALITPTYAVVCSMKMKPTDAKSATEVFGDLEEEEEPENLDANGNPVASNVMAPTAEMFPDYEIDEMPQTKEDVYELRLWSIPCVLRAA